MKQHRLAIVASHVIQYQDPLFRRIAAEPDIGLTVLYCDRRGSDAFHDQDMNATVAWDVEKLLTGYRHRFLRNLSGLDAKRPFLRMLNPGIVPAILRGRFDAVIFMIGWGSATAWLGFLACRLSRTPFFLFGDSSFPPPPRAVRDRLLRAVFRQASGFMTSGKLNADYYAHYGADRNRFFPMPFAIDNDRFAAAAQLTPIEREELRQRHGIGPEEVAIGFSGKLVERKDPRTLVDAFARMRRREQARLVFIGDGPLRPELEKTDRTRFLGFVNQTDLPHAYAMCDVLVLPSRFEPRGLVVNEAMACGLPVIASDRVGAVGDLVQDGENGFVFPAGDAVTLAARLDRIVEDAPLRKRMARRSKELIEQWSFEAEVKGVRAMLERRR
ncbi:MAG TPA: glycosyltransferase family 4 protein [Thermoanaerobaculia bacterium]|jgi:glycosyltransferase involved in cell wall biosynthesis|nr:glycosyltransferase family 4 protein [Thermoanaerobaculia bacterium]